MSTGHATSRTVTFLFPFRLPGMSETHKAGTFDVIADEEQLDVMWDARRSTLSVLLSFPGRIEALPVTTADLEAALLNDRRLNGSA